jgi:hypothetical protein
MPWCRAYARVKPLYRCHPGMIHLFYGSLSTSAAMTRSVRPSTPADAPAIVALLTEAGLQPSVDPQHLHWKYWQPRADWPGPRSYVLTSDSELIAHGAIIPGTCTWGARAGSSAECWCYARITRRREFLLPTPASSSDSRRSTSRQQRQRCGLRNGLRAAAATATPTRRRGTEGRYDLASRARLRGTHRQSEETRDGDHRQSQLPQRSPLREPSDRRNPTQDYANFVLAGATY